MTRAHRSPGSEVRWLLASAGLVASAAWSGGAAAASPHITKGPYLTGLDDDSVEVRFELDGPAAATVEVSAEGAPGAPRVVADASAAMHDVHVGGLEAGKAYTYDVRVAGGPPSAPGRFLTAPPKDAEGTVTFLVSGDNRGGDEVHATLTKMMLETPSDFVVNTGDVVADGGNLAEWGEFFRVEGTLLRDRPIFLCIGNHELYDDQAGANFARYFGYPDASGALQPYGTMRWGNVRIFFLNGMHDWKSGTERAWLEKALADADQEQGLVWRFVVVHHSPWASGPHGGNAKLVEGRVPELLAAHGVDLLFGGHDHIYERGAAQLKYVVSGGGGAKLYDVAHRLPTTRKAESAYHFLAVTTSQSSVKLVARRVDGSLLDQCGFEKGKPWDCDAPLPASPPPSAASPQDPPDAHPPSASKCGCSLPGVASGPAAAGLFAVAALALAALRRRRG